MLLLPYLETCLYFYPEIWVPSFCLNSWDQERANTNVGNPNSCLEEATSYLSGLKIPKETKPPHHRAEQKGIQFRDPALPGPASTAPSPSPPPPHPSLSLLPHF